MMYDKVIKVPYPDDGKIYKWNANSNTWGLDIALNKEEKERIQDEILFLEDKREKYISKGWNISTIDSQIAELENKLLTY